MDSKSQELTQAIAHTMHQKNRSEGMDYIDRWSPEPQHKWVFRWNFGRHTKAKRQEENAVFSPRPALNKMR